MFARLGPVTLRKPELTDITALYRQKNDEAVRSLLGGFSTGYSRKDIERWIQKRLEPGDDVVAVIARMPENECIGHVGLYQIDHRVRAAEFAIVIGEAAARGQGIGRLCTRYAVDYGFRELNLNRISLQVLATNDRAIGLYRSIGFQEEGRLRHGQYRNGQYVDVVLMSILRGEFDG